MEVRIERKDAFHVCGSKIWISGQHNEEFVDFWASAHKSGLVAQLRSLAQPDVMDAGLMGISRVEKKPTNRTFFFYIACETRSAAEDPALERFCVPACTWAVFSNHAENTALGEALLESELYCHMQWLPESGFVHAKAPELEVYPEKDGTLVEYWLPIEEKA